MKIRVSSGGKFRLAGKLFNGVQAIQQALSLGVIYRVTNVSGSTDSLSYTKIDNTVATTSTLSLGGIEYILAISGSITDNPATGSNGRLTVTNLFATRSTLVTPEFTEETITTTGAGSWVKPEGITEVIVEAWGGGGAGGGGISNPGAGAGGAGGQYARTYIQYTSSIATISYSVGAGATGGQGDGVSGSDSTWESTVVIARGGQGGLANASTGQQVAGGTGSINGGVGDVVYSGGNGWSGSSLGAPTSTAYGGSGGSGAGSAGNGNNATAFNTPGAIEPEFGGRGGVGVSTTLTTTTGGTGSLYGGGGAGGATFQAANAVGGSGGQGVIRVIYPKISLPLDAYTGATIAYSTRKLTDSASLCMEVVRDSDNTSQSIGFNSDGLIDTASLLSFVGSGTGYVNVWYNQMTGSYHAGQVTGTTFPNRPWIVSSGSLVLLNGKPAVFFNANTGIGSTSLIPNITNVNAEWFTYAVGNVADTTTRLMVRTVNNTSVLNVAQNIRRNTTNIESIGYNTAGGTGTDLGSVNPGTNQFLGYSQRLPTTVEMYVNNQTNGATTVTGTAYSSSASIYVGFFGGTTTPTFPWSGSIQEVIHFGLSPTEFPYRNGLSNNINSYYGIY